MRDLIVTAIVFGSLPFILKRPYVGMLMWCWLSYMNPHRLTWGFARFFQFAEIVAIVTLIALMLDREKKKIPITPLTALWLGFIFWMCISTYFALVPEAATIQLVKVLKIQLTTFLTILVINSRERLNALIWVIALSIAFFGIKGGVFTLLQGGENRVWGPDGSFIQENNSLAVALLMVLPLMSYLRTQTTNVWVRRGMLAGMVLTGLAALGSYSRGAFISGAAMVLFFWLKSDKKLSTGLAMLLIVPALLAFMPDKWSDRINTIFEPNPTGESWSVATGFAPPIESRDNLHFWPTDRSAIGRINAWNYSINVANARLTGGGLESWESYTFALYAPVLEDVHAAHSIYFSVLADHGWPGLAIYLILGLMTWRTASWVIRHTEGVEELSYLSKLSSMVHVALVAYGSGGAFLSLAYFDLPWHLIAIVVISRYLVEQHQQANVKVPEQRTFLRPRAGLVRSPNL